MPRPRAYLPGEPAAKQSTRKKRDERRGGSGNRQPRRASEREPQEDDIAGHVRGEDAPKPQEADGIDDACQDRQDEERGQPRSIGGGRWIRGCHAQNVNVSQLAAKVRSSPDPDSRRNGPAMKCS